MSIVQREYITVRELGILLDKRKSRVYKMIEEGLLDQVGFHCFRTAANRIFVGVPVDESCSPQQKSRNRANPNSAFSTILDLSSVERSLESG